MNDILIPFLVLTISLLVIISIVLIPICTHYLRQRAYADRYHQAYTSAPTYTNSHYEHTKTKQWSNDCFWCIIADKVNNNS